MVRFADLNAFGIVNNNVYLTYFEIAHTGYWKQLTNWTDKSKGLMIGRAELKYIKPVYLHDEVYAYVRTSRVGNCSFDVEYALTRKSADSEEICTTGKTTCVFFDFKLNKPLAIPEIYKEKMIAFEALTHIEQ